MIVAPSGPSNGLRTPRGPRQSGQVVSPSRGGIKKRPGPSVRVDKDGDLDMGTTGSGGRGRGRSRGTRGRLGGPHSGNTSHEGARSRQTRTGINPSAMQKAILRGMNSGDAVVRGSRAGISARSALKEACRGERGSGGLHQISVRGWKESKASSNEGGGVKELIEFLERKATVPNSPAHDVVRIKKSRCEGDNQLIISVKAEDTPKILKLNNYTFAGAALTIEMVKGPELVSDEAVQLKQKMTAMLSRRYNGELKLLDLSSLGTDTEFANTGMFATHSRQAKFFPALMKVCDATFGTAAAKREAIVSVTLSNNTLPDLATVTTLSQTFPEIKNLDLSNNGFQNLGALEAWRWKFRSLDHLILTGNPLETQVPNYKNEVLKWYPKLRMLNGVQVRSDEQVMAASKGILPLPIHHASFRDEVSIGETFVKNFFPAYDTDRTALINGYYDRQSSFSLSVNVSAPRAPDSTVAKMPTWESYIKKSRNMTKMTSLPARVSRLFNGSEKILEAWLTLPISRHPNLIAEPEKWCIECHPIPGLPDPSRQSPGGVGGLLITTHGEFGEVDVSNGEANYLRSFDRNFVLGPGGGIGGIRVISDVLVLRAYGGYGAWKPSGGIPSTGTIAPPSIQAPPSGQLQIPDGVGIAMPGKPDEQLQKELVALDLSRQTGMTLVYSEMCLSQSGWLLPEALQAFEQVKANLPKEAFF